MGAEHGGDAVSGGSADTDERPGSAGRRAPSVTTMRDIAAAAGVSQSTVSRVLNDVSTRVPIAPETRERVILTARRLGYRPNPLARGLRGAPTMLLGAVVRDFSDPFFAGAIETLAVEAMGSGYNVVLGHAHGRLEEAISLPAVIETRHCDAIVMLGDMQDQPRLLEDLRNSMVPVVALWQGSSPLEFPTVDVDNHAGIFAGLEHLVGLGHERIAFVSGQLPGDNPQRLDAFVEFMTDRFGGVRQGYIQHVPNSMAGGEAALAALLELAERADRARDLDGPGGRRRPPCGLQPQPGRARRAVGRRIRRHPDRRPHGARPDDAPDADPGGDRRGGPARHPVRPRCVARAGGERDPLRADPRRPAVDGAARDVDPEGRRGASRRRSPDRSRRVRPRAWRARSARPARTGIQTRIPPTVRWAHEAYGTAPTSIGLPVAESVAGRVIPSGAPGTSSRATTTGLTDGDRTTASRSVPSGRSAVSTQ